MEFNLKNRSYDSDQDFATAAKQASPHAGSRDWVAESAPDGSQKADEHSVPVVADSDSDSAISAAAAEVDSASAAETCRP